MPIIKYTRTSGESVPEGIIDAGYFPNATQDVHIGVGYGIGTELTVVELLAYIKSLHASVPLTKLSVDDPAPTARDVALNDAEVDELVKMWCQERNL